MRPWWACAILACWAGLACFGWLLPLDPGAMDLERILAPPGPSAWMGYDDLGRPLWDRIAVGARYSFFVALFVVSISAVLGTSIGAASAWAGGWVDHVLTRIIDVFLAFPGILLAIALAGVLGAGLGNVVIALAVVGWVGFARLARAQVLTYREREHVQAAITLGASRTRILWRHLLPLIAAPLIVEATFGIAAVVIAEAGLSFLGLGIQPPAPSWGSMIRDSSRYMLVAPHMVIVPGAALMLVVLAVNALGDRLRDRLDVKTDRDQL
ncbi:MAG: ABC transporter permease [Gammaproteobacteria bacterium]|jgi:peptide/nickel transport system permease protein|nr:ABC transporter permease [Gammaproteobacteria bacterium]